MEKFLSAVKPASQFDFYESTAFKCYNDIHYNLNVITDLVKRFAASRKHAILSTLSTDLDSFVCTLKTDLSHVIKELEASASEADFGTEE